MTDETCCGACGYPIHATKDRACDWCRQTADRIEALTAELAKAVEGLREWDDLIKHQYSGSREAMSDMTYAAQHTAALLAEIEGTDAP